MTSVFLSHHRHHPSPSMTSSPAHSLKPHHIVAMPYPGRGHINTLLNLAGHLSTHGLLVTVVVTEEWLSLLSPPPCAVHFRSIPNVIPSEHGRANDFNGFLDAVNTKLEKPFERLLEGLDPPPEAILADTYLSWMVAVIERRRLPVYSLWTMTAAIFSLFYGFEDIFGGDSTAAVTEEIDKKLEQHVKGLNLGDVSSIVCSATPKKWTLESFFWARGAKGVIFNSVHELEPHMINSLKSKLSCPVYTVGPCIPYLKLKDKPVNSNYMQWLESQPINSVLYLSLGSFLSVSVAQMDEIVTGLHESGIRFLMVHEATLRMCRQRWATQALLCNANVWKVGLNVKEEIGDGCLVGGKVIAKFAKRLMDVEGMEGKEMRKKAVELSEVVHRAVEEGGSSYCSISAFVEDVSSSF
ncbi:UDP-glycosyltransferase 87A2-like [Dioscorea cayenensis subsp. rotundata]|uniref:UDP-glycosyltransferase 87A2-like n=1 Tax=Dioscorea cayennensis subsp. rotundata TaxID=55577 RepID=A0AB40BHZ3_DIOCR|nr:UDP-glycosyltransferase 87A2-like [Dioscorea cayenensis subsp. rotundata]